MPAIPASSTSTTSPGCSANIRMPGGTGWPRRSREANGPVGPLVEELVEVFGVNAELTAEHVGGGGRGGQGDQAAAVLAEHLGVGAHRGRLARPGRAEPGQQEPLVAGERGDQVTAARHRAGCRCGLSNPSSAAAARGPGMPLTVGVRVALSRRCSASRTAWLV